MGKRFWACIHFGMWWKENKVAMTNKNSERECDLVHNAKFESDGQQEALRWTGAFKCLFHFWCELDRQL